MDRVRKDVEKAVKQGFFDYMDWIFANESV